MNKKDKMNSKKILLICFTVFIVVFTLSISIFLYVSYKFPMLNEGYLYLEIDSEYYEYDLNNKEYKKINLGDNDINNYSSMVLYNNGFYIIKEICNNKIAEKYIVYISENKECMEFKVDINTEYIIAANNDKVIFKSYREYENNDTIDFLEILYYLDTKTGEIKELCNSFESYYFNENSFYYCSNNKTYCVDLSEEKYNNSVLFDGNVLQLNSKNIIYEYQDKLYKYDFDSKTSYKVNKLFFNQKGIAGVYKQKEFYIDNNKYVPFFYRAAIFSPKEDEPEYSFEICLFNDLFIRYNNRLMRINAASQVSKLYWVNCLGYSKEHIV